jgi:hydroxyethylthiazole kinase-like sugar kinase family protein
MRRWCATSCCLLVAVAGVLLATAHWNETRQWFAGVLLVDAAAEAAKIRNDIFQLKQTVNDLSEHLKKMTDETAEPIGDILINS